MFDECSGARARHDRSGLRRLLGIPVSEPVGAVEGGDRDHDADTYRNVGQIDHQEVGRDNARKGQRPARGDDQIYPISWADACGGTQ